MVSFNAAASALLSTGLISLAPNLILFCFPGAGTDGSYFLSLGQSFASGGLLGDVFFHTLPHASSSSSDSHEQLEDAGLWVLVGFTLFFMADLCIRTFDRQQQQHHHHKNDNDQKDDGTHHQNNSQTHNGSTKQQQDKVTENHHNMSAIILNLAADAMHNFTDGLAIGASYASVTVNPAETATSTTLTATSLLTTMFSSRGGLASLSILLHEVPHELSDFCTLLRAGFTKSQAILAQFVTALAAVLGTCTALYVSELGGAEQSQMLLLITAGGFVYLAAVTILPEVLLEEKASASLRLAQLVAFVAGMGMLYMVALLEEHDHDHHDHRKTAGEAHHDHAHHGHDHHQHHHHITEL